MTNQSRLESKKLKNLFIGITLIAITLMYIQHGVFFADGIQEASDRFFVHVIQYELMYFLLATGILLSTREVKIKGRRIPYWVSLAIFLTPLLLLRKIAIVLRTSILLALAIGLAFLLSLIVTIVSWPHLYELTQYLNTQYSTQIHLTEVSSFYLFSVLFGGTLIIMLQLSLKVFSRTLYPGMSLSVQNPFLIASAITCVLSATCQIALNIASMPEATKEVLESMEKGFILMTTLLGCGAVIRHKIIVRDRNQPQ